MQLDYYLYDLSKDRVAPKGNACTDVLPLTYYTKNKID